LFACAPVMDLGLLHETNRRQLCQSCYFRDREKSAPEAIIMEKKPRQQNSRLA